MSKRQSRTMRMYRNNSAKLSICTSGKNIFIYSKKDKNLNSWNITNIQNILLNISGKREIINEKSEYKLNEILKTKHQTNQMLDLFRKYVKSCQKLNIKPSINYFFKHIILEQTSTVQARLVA